MESRQKKISIISISLLLHLFVGMFLLIFYKSPEHEWVFIDTTQNALNTPETIFSELSEHPIPEPQQSIPPFMQQEETWAELKPRAGTLGGSMEMPEDNANNQIENDESTREEVSTEPEGELLNQENSVIHTANVSQEQLSVPFIVSDQQTIVYTESDYKPETTQSNQITSAREKKRQAQKALATMTRGYLEQLKHEGENLIKTIGGDPNKMPSAEQLKYERYLAKIQWCLQNAHNINRDKCQMHEPIEATMKVYFTLNRDGKMADLKIVQSSGSAFVDRYIRTLFETASSSFPPLPTYIKEDPYQLLYTVMVCWNVRNPSSFMGLMRE